MVLSRTVVGTTGDSEKGKIWLPSTKTVNSNPQIFHSQMWIYAKKKKKGGSDRSKMLHKENPGHANSFLVYQRSPPLFLILLNTSPWIQVLVFVLKVMVADIWVSWSVGKLGVLEIWWKKQVMGFWLNPGSFFRQIKIYVFKWPFCQQGGFPEPWECRHTFCSAHPHWEGVLKGNNNNTVSNPTPPLGPSSFSVTL